jgi:hypothetical protein
MHRRDVTNNSAANSAAGRPHGEHGAIARALLWVVGGLVLAVLAFVAVAPELAGAEPRLVAELVGVVALAAVPGVILLVLAAIRRKRLGLDDQEPDLRTRVEAEHRPDRPDHRPDQER